MKPSYRTVTDLVTLVWNTSCLLRCRAETSGALWAASQTTAHTSGGRRSGAVIATVSCTTKSTSACRSLSLERENANCRKRRTSRAQLRCRICRTRRGRWGLTAKSFKMWKDSSWMDRKGLRKQSMITCRCRGLLTYSVMTCM